MRARGDRMRIPASNSKLIRAHPRRPPGEGDYIRWWCCICVSSGFREWHQMVWGVPTPLGLLSFREENGPGRRTVFRSGPATFLPGPVGPGGWRVRFGPVRSVRRHANFGPVGPVRGKFVLHYINNKKKPVRWFGICLQINRETHSRWFDSFIFVFFSL